MVNEDTLQSSRLGIQLATEARVVTHDDGQFNCTYLKFSIIDEVVTWGFE